MPTAGVRLDDDSFFPAGKTLNFELPIKAMTLAAGTRLPVEAVLSQPLQLPAGTVLEGALLDAAGNLLRPAGSLLGEALDLPAGTRLGAGSRLPLATPVTGMTWPGGVPLPGRAAGQRRSRRRASGRWTGLARRGLPAGWQRYPPARWRRVGGRTPGRCGFAQWCHRADAGGRFAVLERAPGGWRRSAGGRSAADRSAFQRADAPRRYALRHAAHTGGGWWAGMDPGRGG